MIRQRGLIAVAVVLVVAALPLHSAETAAPAASPLQVFVEPGAGPDPLVQFIHGARAELDGEVYLASSKPVLAALEAAAGRGVHVHILLEHHPYGTGSAVPVLVFHSLAAHGVQVAWSNPAFRYTHAKYMVEPDAGRALICTCNWTTSALETNREFGIVTTDPTQVREAEAVFRADTARGPVQGSVGALVVSPLNARSRIGALIAAARHTLDVYAEEVADAPQEHALIAAVKRGVRVRVVTTGDGDDGVLIRGGVQVVVTTSPYIHAKAVVADGVLAFVGSENISSTSLDHNREMGLLTRDPGVIAAVESAFSQDSGGGTAGGTTPVSGTPIPAGPGPGAGLLSVRVTVTPSPTVRGTATTITATTMPGATCVVRVVYASGTRSTSTKLATTQTVGSTGQVAWTWAPATRTAGTARATVSCTRGTATGRGTASFMIGA